MIILFWTLPLGVFVGLVARLLQPVTDRMGILPSALLGMAGSAGATYGGEALGLYPAGHSASILGATLGATALITMIATVRWLAR